MPTSSARSLTLAAVLMSAACSTLTPPVSTTGARFSSEGTGKQLLSAAKHRPSRRHLPTTSRSLRRSPLENRHDAPKPAPKHASPLNWSALAQCEASGNPHAVSMGRYFGLYQFDLQTWASVGGVGNPADASPAEQTHRAELLYAERGSAPWPVCGFHLGDAA